MLTWFLSQIILNLDLRGDLPPSNLAQICPLGSLIAKNIAFFTDFGLFLT
jgi:hypothetical protein